ncbi:hypothetical protein [Botrimarina sp.]|uniref:hypothetical protein n=1 Tax=Botrimarina sp. TaxID=2795802 RepID=UPI0032EAF503
MSYKSVEQLLSLSQELHSETQRLLGDCRDGNEMAARLTDRVAHHHRQVEQTLSDVKDDAQPSVLNTQVQYTEDDELRVALQKLSQRNPPESGGSCKEIIDEVIGLESRLVNLYRLAADQVQSPRAKEVLQSLADLERSRTEDQGWAAAQSDEITRPASG